MKLHFGQKRHQRQAGDCGCWKWPIKAGGTSATVFSIPASKFQLDEWALSSCKCVVRVKFALLTALYSLDRILHAEQKCFVRGCFSVRRYCSVRLQIRNAPFPPFLGLQTPVFSTRRPVVWTIYRRLQCGYRHSLVVGFQTSSTTSGFGIFFKL